LADDGEAVGLIVGVGGLLEVEEEGRELASYYGAIDYDFLEKISEWAEEAHDKLTGVYDSVVDEAEKLKGKVDVEKLSNLIWSLRHGPDTTYSIARYCKIFGEKAGQISTRQCNSQHPNSIVRGEFEELMKKLREIDRLSKEVLGKRCTWLLGEVEPYTLNAAINDVTSCIHSVATFLAKAFKIPTKIKEVSKKCSVLGEATKEAVEFCKTWDKVTEEIKQIYSDVDYKALEGFVTDNKVQLRVGSTAGHMTHVDLGRGIVEYYDLDEEVNMKMKEFLEKAGLECTLMGEELSEGVRCEGKITDKVAKALALATTMDVRMVEEPEEWSEDVKKIAPECAYLDPKERETCLFEKIVKNSS